MDLSAVSAYMTQYGLIAVFTIVLLEYMNLPGFPAGVIMPASGILCAQGGLSFLPVLAASVLAGLCGSWLLYLLGRLGGNALLDKLLNRFPKRRPAIDRTLDHIRQNGYPGIFLAKLMPAVRTLISIPAGVLSMDFAGYTLFSALGITVWNLVFIGAGYLFGETALRALSFS